VIPIDKWDCDLPIGEPNTCILHRASHTIWRRT